MRKFTEEQKEMLTKVSERAISEVRTYYAKNPGIATKNEQSFGEALVSIGAKKKLLETWGLSTE